MWYRSAARRKPPPKVVDLRQHSYNGDPALIGEISV